MNAYTKIPVCLHCEEPIFDDFADPPQPMHATCLARMVIGGLNHLRHLCTCCGGTLPPDPPDLSKREAARQALAYFRWMHQPVQPSRKPGNFSQ
jgi:hypothetical protein